MKIRFRIGPEQHDDQGNEQAGEQSPRQPWSVYPPPPRSPRGPVSAGTPPTKSLADHSLRLRQGTALAVPNSSQDSGVSTPEAREITLPGVGNSREITQFSVMSNRFWLKNRSRRKQKTKPCLTGSRIAQCEARPSRDFSANFAPAELHPTRPPTAWRTAEL